MQLVTKAVRLRLPLLRRGELMHGLAFIKEKDAALRCHSRRERGDLLNALAVYDFLRDGLTHAVLDVRDLRNLSIDADGAILISRKYLAHFLYQIIIINLIKILKDLRSIFFKRVV